MKRRTLYAVVTVLIWSTLAALVKSLLGDIPNLEALSVSSVFSFLFLLIVNACSGRLSGLRRYGAGDFLRMAGLGFLGLFLYSALYYRGIGILTSQEACILNYLWPMMLVLFSSLLLKEKMTRRKMAALLCSFLGIVLLSLGEPAGAGEHRLLGMACCVLGAGCYGLFSVLNKKADYDQEIAMMVIWLTVAVCAGATGLLTESWVRIRGVQWLGILWLGVVIDGLAYLLWALALNGAENSAAVANLAYLTPFLSLLVSAAALHEKIEARAFLALVFIMGGILIQNGRPIRGK